MRVVEVAERVYRLYTDPVLSDVTLVARASPEGDASPRERRFPVHRNIVPTARRSGAGLRSCLAAAKSVCDVTVRRALPPREKKLDKPRTP